jgi:hypothetical protein
VAGVDVAQVTLLVELRVEEGGVLARGRRSVDELVHPRDEAWRRHVAVGRDEPQRRLHDGHDQGGGDPFSRHVGERDADPAVAQLDEIVVVAADAARG